jgi:branched-chain amino acid transport system permease protein
MTVEAGSTDTKTTSAEGAVKRPGGGLLGSTFLRHAGLMLLAYVGILLLLQVIDPFRGSQLGEMAYFIPAVAGLTVLTGLNGQISLGHGALMAVGAYTTALMLDEREGPPYLLVVLLSVLTTVALGALVGAAAARLHGPYLAGATLALAVGLPGLALTFEETLGGEQGLQVRPPRASDGLESFVEDTIGWELRTQTYLAYIGWALALLVLFLLSNLVVSRYGRTWRAVRDDEVAASSPASTWAARASSPSSSARRAPAWPARSSPSSRGSRLRRRSRSCCRSACSSASSSAGSAASSGASWAAPCSSSCAPRSPTSAGAPV